MNGDNPCREDWCSEIIIDNPTTKKELTKILANKILELYEVFDVEEETYLMLEAKRNGFSGVPGVVALVHNESKKQYELTKQFLERSVLEQCDIYSKYLSKHIKNLFERLHNNNKAITSTLLIEAGIITSELKNLRINVDDL